MELTAGPLAYCVLGNVNISSGKQELLMAALVSLT